MTKAMYAFSGDPITYGHIDIVKRACKVFEQVIVGIGTNPDKKYMFSLEERLEMAQRSLSKISNVKVVSFPGLLVDYAYENNVPVIVKGVRDNKDFDYEVSLHQIGESQKQEIDTFLIPAKKELAHVSSSSVKALQKEQGLIHEYVTLYVKQCLEAKMSGQYIVGVTGEIGAGKSYLAKKIEELGKTKGVQVHNIDLDIVGHKILGDLTEPLYSEAREKVIKTFGESIRSFDGTINRKTLGEIVFNDSEKLKKLNELLHPSILMRLRRELYGKRGLILVNAALIAEAEITYLTNNNIILLTANKQSQERRLISRGLTKEQIERRLASQYSFEEKKKKIEEKILQDNQGKIWAVDNSDNSNSDNIKFVFEEIINALKIK